MLHLKSFTKSEVGQGSKVTLQMENYKPGCIEYYTRYRPERETEVYRFSR